VRCYVAADARLDLRMDPADKRLIEEAAASQHVSVTRFVVEALVRRAREVVGDGGRRAPRPVGGWSFSLPEGWDDDLDDFAEWR
jgi:hypothetical protein